MRKSVAAAAMAASLAVGGAAGVTLFTPTLSGAQADTTETETEGGDAERPRLTERLREELQPLVDDSTIDAGQADAVAEHLAEQAPLRHGPQHGLGFGDEVAEALGLGVEDLRAALAEGRSLADVADAQGVDVQEVVDAIVAAQQDRLDEAIADGRLTQDEADERAAALEEHVDELVERTFDAHRGPGHRHGGPFGGGDAEDPTDDDPTDDDPTDDDPTDDDPTDS